MLRHTTLCAALLIPTLGLAQGPSVDADGRPKIVKLGTIDIDKVENSPIVFRDKLYRFEWFRNAKCYHFVEHATGRATAQFAAGWAFGNAFVEGQRVYVTGTKFGPEIRMFISDDLEHWQERTALRMPDGFGIYNTSICRADNRFVMMFEIGEPPEEAGARFTARFAESTDLLDWKPLPAECNYAKDRYTAPHCLRYLDGYFYNFYLEAVPGGYHQYVVRSKDLIQWQQSPLNPVLQPSDDDRRIANPQLDAAARKRIAEARNINNSDIDLCPHQGRLIINYSWGNQTGVEHLAEAEYRGSLADFLRGWFPPEPADARP